MKKDFKIFLLLASIMFSSLLLLTWLEWNNFLPEKILNGVYRPKSNPPSFIIKMDKKSLIEYLNHKSDFKIYLKDDQFLILKPNKMNHNYPNPWLETKINLKNSDPYIFSQKIKKEGYGLVLFCSKSKYCISNTHLKSKKENSKYLYFFKAKKKEEIKIALEVMRRLIILSGGISTLNKSKSLSRLTLENDN